MEPSKAICKKCKTPIVPEVKLGHSGFCTILVCPACDEREVISVTFLPVGGEK